MRINLEGTTGRFWALSIGLSIALFALALFVAERTGGSIPLFLAVFAPAAPFVVGYFSRSWLGVLSPLLAWLVFTLIWAIAIVNVSHDPNVQEALSWLHTDLWFVWPLLASGFAVGKLIRTAVRTVWREA